MKDLFLTMPEDSAYSAKPSDKECYGLWGQANVKRGCTTCKWQFPCMQKFFDDYYAGRIR